MFGNLMSKGRVKDDEVTGTDGVFFVGVGALGNQLSTLGRVFDAVHPGEGVESPR